MILEIFVRATCKTYLGGICILIPSAPILYVFTSQTYCRKLLKSIVILILCFFVQFLFLHQNGHLWDAFRKSRPHSECLLPLLSAHWIFQVSSEKTTTPMLQQQRSSERIEIEQRRGKAIFIVLEKKKKEDLDEIVQFIFICKILVE